MRRASMARRVAVVVAMFCLIGTGPVEIAAAASSTPGAWATTGSLPHGTGFAPAVLLNDGTVITAGGTDGATFTAAAERYTSGTWASAGSIGQTVAGQVAALLPDGKALFAGGVNDMAYYMKGDLFDPVGGTWAQTPGSMSHGHAYGSAASLKNGDVLVIGGGDGGDTFITGAVDIYSASGGTWSEGPSLPGPRYEMTATTLSDGRVVVAGGDDGSNAPGSALSSVEIYTSGSGWARTMPASTQPTCSNSPCPGAVALVKTARSRKCAAFTISGTVATSDTHVSAGPRSATHSSRVRRANAALKSARIASCTASSVWCASHCSHPSARHRFA